MRDENTLDTVMDSLSSYHHKVAKILAMLYPQAPVTIINAGVSGDDVVHGYSRLKRDVLRFQPDLVIVSYGLNDSLGGIDKMDRYADYLGKIFAEIQNSGCECVFMTENMMNTYVSHRIRDEKIKAIAKNTMKCENSGILEQYFDTARKTAEIHGVKVCDVYAKWRAIAKNGVDTTALLSNDINHPTQEMHWLFAYALVETLMNS